MAGGAAHRDAPVVLLLSARSLRGALCWAAEQRLAAAAAITAVRSSRTELDMLLVVAMAVCRTVILNSGAGREAAPLWRKVRWVLTPGSGGLSTDLRQRGRGSRGKQ